MVVPLAALTANRLPSVLPKYIVPSASTGEDRIGPPVAYFHFTPSRLRGAFVLNTPVRCKLPRKTPGSAALPWPAAKTRTAKAGTRRRMVLTIDNEDLLGKSSWDARPGRPAVRPLRLRAARTGLFIVSFGRAAS